MRVAVCTVSYLRPQGLRRLLQSLSALTFEKSETPTIDLVVVDNDPNGSAAALCKEMRPMLSWPLKSCVESRRGISYARNRAIDLAGRDVDFVAFIDDDEVPEPLWLDQLLHVQKLYDADVVGGPVKPRFEEPVPDWVLKGGFFGGRFEQPDHPTGQPLEFVAAGNVLVRADVFEKMDEAFDPRWGLTGGEDVHFFARVHRAGFKIVWAAEALAHEYIPRSRASAGFILRRSYRLGLTLALWEKHVRPSRAVQALRIVKATVWIILGLLLVVPSAVLGFHVLMRALQYVFRGVGMFTGLIGVRYEIYR